MEDQINCICVDDEPLALDVLESLIQRHPRLRLSRKCSNAVEASDCVREQPVQVVFTDINMPGITGVDFARSIRDKGCVVVFTTAYQEYAAEAFDIAALDFLLKPISPERFAQTVKRIEEYFELRKLQPKDNVELAEGSIFVKSDGKLLKVAYNEIMYVEAFADYVKIWIGEDKRIVTLQTMKSMEQGLPEDKFVRLHRSYIVGIDKIGAVQSTSVTIGKREIPVGKNYRDNLTRVMQNMKRINR